MKPYEVIYEDRHFNSYLRNGLIVDSCVLLEFLNLHHLNTKESYSFTEEEEKLFLQLSRFLSVNSKKYITPHILAELSNLINKITSNPEDFSKLINLIKEKLEEYEEIHLGKKEILDELSVNKFGITDVGIKLLSKQDDKIILTKDGPFCTHCKYDEMLPTIHLEDLQSLCLTLSMFKD
jgi:rRNA-processing protein FCF1